MSSIVKWQAAISLAPHCCLFSDTILFSTYQDTIEVVYTLWVVQITYELFHLHKNLIRLHKDVRYVSTS